MAVTVVGAGGLGGFVINGLARLGAKNIAVIDFDIFQSSNINRQLFSNDQTLGQFKAEAAKEFVSQISGVQAAVICQKVTKENVNSLLSGAEAVFDCVDNAETKLILEEFCIANKVALFHGGVNGSYGQAAIIYGNPVLKKLLGKAGRGKNAVVTPQIISGLQLNLFVSYINGVYNAGTVYYYDCVNMELAAFKEV